MKGLTYKEAGVDIDAGNRAVELIKEKVRKTMRPEVLTDIGGFGGLFALDISKYRQPVLVSGTDGVGTKLRVAMLMDKHDTIGIDCVAMCVNDILVQGAEPLFFLDYLAVGKLDPEQVAAIVGGIAEGCREAGCALIGGETAEMPGFYPPGEYDVAGFAVGVVDKEKILDGSRVREGMTVLGLASHGLHSNGYSLARKVLLERAGLNLDLYLPELGCTVGEELLKPTRIYVRSLLPLVQEGRIAALAHITGGGLLENIPRVLPPGLGVELTAGSWPIPPIFDLIEKLGHIAKEEMARTFNLGIGMVAIVAAEEAPAIADRLKAAGEKVYTIGRVVAGAGVQVV
ncbi:phosphoribosylformylglycinamidine cyclo-ligase [Carboxydocella sporoproducens DSM 16521]|uniref:Phosphoribosylformylglycinamidine cyclo-ligase n=2 Tax=Carboxydocella TaxID=178898 RepID=A0A1T4QA33_9FIRM|nr:MULTISPECIES: phosphoribosylformylglycinamidine cyclo-ligase [Carboxydocella]AVX19361.1 phosphoribosylformylglycinamidine cyclo-ligase [Carboxydocella thermautotrophica]AVX29775.1 phosphoribosylformylglycinamidine cyclo-ligase [Carboxydocella thermautotrophica]SKA00632.1 phosphoribosylformylglycinamidine cyclo-ligase [Carboxydocella sporoproducens DSM 16521]